MKTSLTLFTNVFLIALHSTSIQGMDLPLTATHDQICNHEQQPLSDEIFDLASLSTQQQEELISIWRMPDGQTMTGQKRFVVITRRCKEIFSVVMIWVGLVFGRQ